MKRETAAEGRRFRRYGRGSALGREWELGSSGSGLLVHCNPAIHSPVIPRSLYCHPARSVGICSPCTESGHCTLRARNSSLTRSRRGRGEKPGAWNSNRLAVLRALRVRLSVRLRLQTKLLSATPQLSLPAEPRAPSPERRAPIKHAKRKALRTPQPRPFPQSPVPDSSRYPSAASLVHFRKMRPGSARAPGAVLAPPCHPLVVPADHVDQPDEVIRLRARHLRGGGRRGAPVASLRAAGRSAIR